MAPSSSTLSSPDTPPLSRPSAPATQLDLDLVQLLAAADGGDGAPVSPFLERPECPVPPPRAQLPPNFTLMVLPENSLVVPLERVWEEVGGRHLIRLKRIYNF
jgi:hypothetical protein